MTIPVISAAKKTSSFTPRELVHCESDSGGVKTTPARSAPNAPSNMQRGKDRVVGADAAKATAEQVEANQPPVRPLLKLSILLSHLRK